MSGPFGPLVDGGWLAGHLQDEDVRVIDFRWYLDGRSGRAAYESGHIPGAVFVDLDAEVTGHEPGGGRHPLPSASQFQLSMRRAGVWSKSRVVVYDDMGGFSAARLWWLLRYFGHPAVAVLDGGLQSWTGAISTEAVEVGAADFVATGGPEGMKADYEQLRTESGGLVFLDARAPERFRGEVEPIDPKAGRIPGARSRPWQANLDAHARFLPPEELRRGFQDLGIRSGSEAVAYCGSGVSACHNVLALEIAGMPRARLYPGSWSDWCRRPDAPVATGLDD
ncbi:MAG: sulfurtransferase, partial [Candidatus Dormibacteraeota bacterium]|nr:sulfurtransferase [Candidatus Dormibacteraeota bacterium]